MAKRPYYGLDFWLLWGNAKVTDEMKKINFNNYSIYLNPKEDFLKGYFDTLEYSSLFVLVDENTWIHCLPILKSWTDKNDIHVIDISAGEQYKTIDTCKDVWSALLSAGADRNSLLINLGGGMLGDLGGFVASTFMRGIRFINIPTTLLSMVDASVGSKLGVDLNNTKNIVGLFNDPSDVIIYPDFLETLDERQLRSGYAEVIKSALIASKELWNKLQKIVDLNKVEDWTEIIEACNTIKKSIVEQDPNEGGLRKVLNFGHTLGHGMESASLETENPLLHGEAIALGMICESWMASQMNLLDTEIYSEIKSYILDLYKELNYSELNQNHIIDFILSDKKNVSDKIYYSPINSIGSCLYDIEADKLLIQESMNII